MKIKFKKPIEIDFDESPYLFIEDPQTVDLIKLNLRKKLSKKKLGIVEATYKLHTPKQLIEMIDSLKKEMDSRYKVLETNQIWRDPILNAKAKSKMPYIFLCIEDLTDFLINKEIRKELENKLIQIAGLGRGAKIHLIFSCLPMKKHIFPEILFTNIQYPLSSN